MPARSSRARVAGRSQHGHSASAWVASAAQALSDRAADVG